MISRRCPNAGLLLKLQKPGLGIFQHHVASTSVAALTANKIATFEPLPLLETNKRLVMRDADWASFLAENLFSDLDGSYELPYLSNSPQLMAQSSARLPVTDHNQDRQVINTDNPFFKGTMHYREAGKELWVLATEITPKKDLVSRAIYDGTKEAGYYFLSFAVFEYHFPLPEEHGKAATIISTTCTFYKPRTEVATFFYPGSHGRFYNIAFFGSLFAFG